MDFIERLTGFNSDGALEAVILITLITVFTGLAVGFFRERDL